MTQQGSFHLDARDVLSPADDDVLETIADLDVAIRMDDCGVTGMKPATLECLFRGLRVVVVPLHHDVAANHDLTAHRSIGGNLRSRLVDDANLARSHQLDSLPCFDACALGQRKL